MKGWISWVASKVLSVRTITTIVGGHEIADLPIDPALKAKLLGSLAAVLVIVRGAQDVVKTWKGHATNPGEVR